MNTEIPSEVEDIIISLQNKSLYPNQIFSAINKIHSLCLKEKAPDLPNELIQIVNNKEHSLEPISYLVEVSEYLGELLDRKIEIRAKWIF